MDLVDLIGTLAQQATTAPPEAVDPGRPTAWERHRPAAEALLSDPDRAVRYAALRLTPTPAKLLERRRAEKDATVRDPLLPTSTAAAAGTEWEPEVSALLHGLLLDDDAVLRLTAVQAWAAIDPAVPARHVGLMADVLADPANRPAWLRLTAATALWSITGDPEPTLPVLAGFVAEIAEGGDNYGAFRMALEALARIGTLTPETEADLRTIRARDRRLSPHGDYRAVLDDEALRATIKVLLARAAGGVAGAAVRAEDGEQASGTKQEERPDQPAQGPDQG